MNTDQAGDFSQVRQIAASPIRVVRQVTPLGMSGNRTYDGCFLIGEVGGNYILARSIDGPPIEESPGLPKLLPANRFRVV